MGVVYLYLSNHMQQKVALTRLVDSHRKKNQVSSPQAENALMYMASKMTYYGSLPQAENFLRYMAPKMTYQISPLLSKKFFWYKYGAKNDIFHRYRTAPKMTF